MCVVHDSKTFATCGLPVAVRMHATCLSAERTLQRAVEIAAAAENVAAA